VTDESKAIIVSICDNVLYSILGQLNGVAFAGDRYRRDDAKCDHDKLQKAIDELRAIVDAAEPTKGTP